MAVETYLISKKSDWYMTCWEDAHLCDHGPTIK